MRYMSLFTTTMSIAGFLVSLVSAIGFMNEGCNTFTGPWILVDAYVETYCNDHVCNQNSQTRLNLNNCIENVDGVMTPRKAGHFGKSCSWCEITRNYTSIKCGCAKLNGDWVDAEIDISDLLYNWFGYLSCFNIYEYFWDHAFDCRPGWHPGPNDNDTTCSHGGCSWTDHQAIGPLDIGAGAAGVPRNATDRLEEYLRRGGKQA